MGDRFYAQQAGKTGHSRTKSATDKKPKRKLKADYVSELNSLLGAEVPGLEKLTIASLTELTKAIEEKLNAS